MKISRILIDFLLRARFSGHFDFYFSLLFILILAFFVKPAEHFLYFGT